MRKDEEQGELSARIFGKGTSRRAGERANTQRGNNMAVENNNAGIERSIVDSTHACSWKGAGPLKGRLAAEYFSLDCCMVHGRLRVVVGEQKLCRRH